MFRKLIERDYNKKVIKSLQNVEFDSFAFCGYNEFPMFEKFATEYENNLLFTPKTNETFKLAFLKLKDVFFKTCDLEEIKIRLNIYKSYFNISEETCEACIKMAQSKICEEKEVKTI